MKLFISLIILRSFCLYTQDEANMNSMNGKPIRQMAMDL